jgi:dihydrofolate reductase
MSLSIIAAMDKNQLIGNQGAIPWKLPADLQHFKQITMGSPIIMGRKTFESLARPLPGRTNIIMTKNKNYSADGCLIVHSAAEIFKKFLNKEEEAFIIGGEEIYKTFLPYSNKLYLTMIDNEFSGDTYFPEINWQNWLKLAEEKGTTDSNNPYSYSYHVYQRKQNFQE